MFESLQERLGSILNGLTGRGALSEADVSAALREVRRALIEADVALDVVRGFTDRVREKAVGAAVLKSIKPGQMVVKIVHDELVEMLGSEGKTIDLNAPAPVVDRMFGRQLAIISSMTKQERANPDILKHSRKKRIAAGSGTDAAEINKLLKMHRGMADMMKAMGGKGKGGGLMRGMMGGLASKMGLGGMMPGGMGGMGGMPD